MPLHMRDEIIEIENVLRTVFIEINTALGAVLYIMKKPPARQTHQFASNNLAGYHALGVAESICNGCHSSFALFKEFFQRINLSRGVGADLGTACGCHTKL